MTSSSPSTWYPTRQQIAEANVTKLAASLGLQGLDALQRLSVADPAAYWRAVGAFCGIVWSKPYEAYCDLSRGKEFPRWFVGGELNWTDTVFSWCERPHVAERPAIVAETEDGTVTRVTYRELKRRVERFAAGLRARGLGRGDRIGLLMESGIEATIALLAVSCIGGIIVPLFSGFGGDAIVSRLGSCGARALIATAGFSRRGRLVDTAPVVDEARERVPSIELLVLKPTAGHRPQVAHAVDYAAVDADAGDAKAERMSPDDPFMVIYTSGTTGRPKGTVHTHGGFPLKIAHDSAVHFDVKPGDVFCWPADMGWVAGALVISSALLRGATLVTYDGAPDFPDWSRMSRLIERHKITQYGAAPTLIRGLAANEPLSTTGDTSSVRLLITAGEAIAPEHFVWQQRVFGKGVSPMINYTGGTEVSGALLASVPVRPIQPAVFNTASPGIAVDVVDTEGHSVEETVGELVVLEPFVGMTQSFWQDDERYLDTYWRTLPGRWVHGDLAMSCPRFLWTADLSDPEADMVKSRMNRIMRNDVADGPVGNEVRAEPVRAVHRPQRRGGGVGSEWAAGAGPTLEREPASARWCFACCAVRPPRISRASSACRSTSSSAGGRRPKPRWMAR